MIGGGDDDGGGGEEVCSGKAEPMLVSLSDSYSEDEEISVCDSCQDCRQWTLFLFSLFTLFYFYFYFFFSFLFFEQTRVRAYQSRCHISHKLMA